MADTLHDLAVIIRSRFPIALNPRKSSRLKKATVTSYKHNITIDDSEFSAKN